MVASSRRLIQCAVVSSYSIPTFPLQRRFLSIKPASSSMVIFLMKSLGSSSNVEEDGNIWVGLEVIEIEMNGENEKTKRFSNGP